MTEQYNQPQIRDAALGALSPELRSIILKLDDEQGHPSLTSVMAARYGERNGPGSERDYLHSLRDQEGIIMPIDQRYTDALHHFDQLLGKNLPSGLRDQLANGTIDLPKGSLVHSMEFDPDALTTIALTGVIARDFSPDVDGAIMNDDMVCSAYFFKAEYAGPVSSLMTSLAKKPMARKRLPGAEDGADSIAIVFDAAIPDPDYQALAGNHSEDYAARPKAAANSAAAIPVGLPAGGIAGFVLGENIASDPLRVEYTRSLFPGVPLLTAAGTLIG